MKTRIETFITSFKWYRDLSLQLLNEIPDKAMSEKISKRSLPMGEQFIDLGDMQLKIVEQLVEKKLFDLNKRPSFPTSKEIIKEYLISSDSLVNKELRALTDYSRGVDWFGRMKFNFWNSLTFLLAHEAMHHGEILSFIYGSKHTMPPALRDTWGFER